MNFINYLLNTDLDAWNLDTTSYTQFSDAEKYLEKLNEQKNLKFKINPRLNKAYILSKLSNLFPSILITTYLLVYFTSYYSKCYANFSYQANINTVNYLTNFTINSTNQTKFSIVSMPFCSCLYQDGYYLKNETHFGHYLNFNIIYSLLAFEILIVGLLSIKSGAFLIKISTKLGIRSKPAILFSYFGLILIFWCCSAAVLEFIYFILNELFVFSIDKHRNDKSSNKAVTVHLNFQIQLISFYCVLILKDRLKYFGLYGVLIIKHMKQLQKWIKYSFISSALIKLAQSLNDMNVSDLMVIYRDDCEYVSANLSNVHCNSTSIIEVKDLKSSVKYELRYELYEYIYDNTNFNKLYPAFIFVFSVYYFVFLPINIFYIKFKVYKPDLDMACIEQYLEKYFECRKLADELDKINCVLPLLTRNNKFKKRSVLNLVWVVFYKIYELFNQPSEKREIIDRINENCKKIKLSKS